MSKTTSIAIVAKDQYSSTINNIRNSHQSFNKDIEETITKIKNLEKRQESLGAGMSKSQVKMEDANRALKEAKKAYAELSDEANKTNLDKAYQEVNRVKGEVKEWGQAMNDTQKEMRNLWDDYSRQNNRVGLDSLASAGLGMMVGNSMTNALNVAISSAFGDTAGNAISSLIGGAMSGAAIGSIAGPLGSAVGAAVGLVSGGINAATTVFAAEDDAFKSYVQDAVQGQWTQQAEDLQSGSSIASSRERQMVSLQQMFGNEDAATEFWDNTLERATVTPFYVDDLIGIGKNLRIFGFENEELFDQLSRISDAGAVLGWEASDMDSISQTIGYMYQSGITDTRRLRQLQLQGINVPRYLAIAGSITGQEGQLSDEEIRTLFDASDEELQAAGIHIADSDIYDMLSSGEIDGRKAAQVILDYMSLEFEGGAAALSETFYGLQSTLGGVEQNMLAAMGQGFNDEREKGIREQIEFYQGEGGGMLEDANYLIGQWEASLENTRDEMERTMMTAVMSGNTEMLEGLFDEDMIEEAARMAAEYQEALAEDSGADAGRVLAQARIAAEAAYNASEGAQMQLASQQQLIEDVSTMLVANGAYYKAGLLLGEQFSEGMASAILNRLSRMEGFGITAIGDSDPILATMPDIPITASDEIYSIMPDMPRNNAWGLPYVPYDGFPTRLHEGERVLTAQEARSMDSGGAANISINCDSMVVREEADIYKIAQALATEIQQAQQIM